MTRARSDWTHLCTCYVQAVCGLAILSLRGVLAVSAATPEEELFLASVAGDREELIDHRALIDARSKRLVTPLHLAARAGHRRVVEELIYHGAGIDARTENLSTSLHLAAKMGHQQVAEELLSSGAAVSPANKYLWTPLHYAAHRMHVEVVHSLLEHGAAVNAATSAQWTPLHLSAKAGHTKVVKELIDHGALVNMQDRAGRTPLHKAAMYSNLRTLKFLVNVPDIDILAPTDDGKTAYELARISHASRAATLLEQHGGNPNKLTRLLNAVVKHPVDFTIALVGGLATGALAAGAAMILFHPRHGIGGIRRPTSPTEAAEELLDFTRYIPPLGAQLLAAEILVTRHQCGSARTMFRKMYFMTEIFMNLVLVFGPAMYHRSPLIIVPAWLLLWCLPATLHFGLANVISSPVLVATSGHCAWLKALAWVRFCALLVAANAALLFFAAGTCQDWIWSPETFNPDLALQYQLFSCEEYYHPVGWVPWDKRGVIEFAIFRHNVNMISWFQSYERGVICLAGLGALLGVLLHDSLFAHPPGIKEEVRALALSIDEAGGAEEMKRIGLKPVVWHPRPPVDVGLTIRLFMLVVDMYFDIMVMLDLLARQHYQFFGVMLFIVASTLLNEVFQGGGPGSMLPEYRKTLAQGYMSEGLLCLFHKEASLEAFGQLAITTYALAFLTQQPLPLLTAMLSMLSSTYTLASHLHYLIDLVAIMEDEEEEVEDVDEMEDSVAVREKEADEEEEEETEEEIDEDAEEGAEEELSSGTESERFSAQL